MTEIHNWLLKWQELLGAFIGPMLGAFFAATLAIWVGDRRARRDRNRRMWVLHRNELARLEKLLSSAVSTIHGNLFIVDVIVNAKIPEDQRLPITFEEPLPIRIEPVQISNLLSTDLMNEVFALGDRARRINRDMASTSRTFAEFRTARINGIGSDEAYLQAFRDEVLSRVVDWLFERFLLVSV